MSKIRSFEKSSWVKHRTVDGSENAQARRHRDAVFGIVNNLSREGREANAD